MDGQVTTEPPLAVDPCWNTFERNANALSEKRDQLLKSCEEHGVRASAFILTVRESTEEIRDARGTLKRPRVWRCSLWATTEPK